jgi:hypothetical protein
MMVVVVVPSRTFLILPVLVALLAMVAVVACVATAFAGAQRRRSPIRLL